MNESAFCSFPTMTAAQSIMERAVATAIIRLQFTITHGDSGY